MGKKEENLGLKPFDGGDDNQGPAPAGQGGDRTRVAFNPSGKVEVDTVKRQTAELIDSLQIIVDHGDEAGRCAAIAQTKYEEASMWAVKAHTAN